jgi:hypothetical protein
VTSRLSEREDLAALHETFFLRISQGNKSLRRFFCQRVIAVSRSN